MGTGTMATLEWDETTWGGEAAADAPLPKMTAATDRATIDGQIEGEVADRWLMTTPPTGPLALSG